MRYLWRSWTWFLQLLWNPSNGPSHASIIVSELEKNSTSNFSALLSTTNTQTSVQKACKPIIVYEETKKQKQCYLKWDWNLGRGQSLIINMLRDFPSGSKTNLQNTSKSFNTIALLTRKQQRTLKWTIEERKSLGICSRHDK